MPKTRLREASPPRLDPDIVVREDVLDGEPIVAVLPTRQGELFPLDPAQWELAQLFDGVRSYEEIAEQFTAQTGAPTGRKMCGSLPRHWTNPNFWYKTPQEKNLALSQKLMAQRGRRAERKSKFNLTHMSFSAMGPGSLL